MTACFTGYERLSCPVCGAPLHRDGVSLFCGHPGRTHCFDVASSGYVNLLPPGKAGNARTGDDGEMLRARARFLALGLYDGISDGLTAAARPALGGRPEVAFADAGCGEGYHTCRVAAGLAASLGVPVTAYGFDASKKGAAAGARRARALSGGAAAFFGAGNLFHLPLASGSMDLLISLFAPIAGDESARVLREDGLLLVGAAGRRHLWELRELLYDEPREAGGEIRTPDGFVPVREETVSYRAHVPSGEALRDLFSMTPFAWRTSREGRERLDRAESLDVTVEVLLKTFRKRKEGESV